MSGPLRRVAAAGLVVLAVGHVVDALVLRRRHRCIPVLPEGDATSPKSSTYEETGPGPAPQGPQYSSARSVLSLAARGTHVDESTAAAAGVELDAAQLDAVDLVPGNLPAERLLRLLRRVDPKRLDLDPLYSPGGAHEALTVRAALADRIVDSTGTQPGLEERDPTAPGTVVRHDRASVVRLTVKAQRYAPARTGLRRAPGLRVGYYGPDDRWAELAEATAFQWPPGSTALTILRGELAHLAVLAAGVVVAPPAGLAALAAWSAKPALALGAPAGGASLARWPAAVTETARALLVGRRTMARTRSDGAAASTSFCDPDVAPGDHIRVTEPALVPRPAPGALFEERRTACPWCGAGDLADRIAVTDLLQHKPGWFRLDECRACGHIFQNPALSEAGLDYHYDQFYDGIAEDGWERVSVAMAPQFRARAEAVARVAERPPRAWLDVGTGPGHFCLLARQRWPDATFDGLDMGDTVDEAERRGWVDQGHRGLFPDLAEKLTGAYDVVSMYHYLEHTRDPRRELAAAATVLTSGGHLVVEVPDPESPWARRLGRYWLCWFQPQHQHFVSCDNLAAALDEAGFTVVSVERGPSTMGWDLAGAVMLFFGHHLPKAPAPWLPPPTRGRRVARWLGAVPAVPALALAAAIDVAKDALARRPGNTRPGNAYRVVAERR